LISAPIETSWATAFLRFPPSLLSHHGGVICSTSRVVAIVFDPSSPSSARSLFLLFCPSCAALVTSIIFISFPTFNFFFHSVVLLHPLALVSIIPFFSHSLFVFFLFFLSLRWSPQ